MNKMNDISRRLANQYLIRYLRRHFTWALIVFFLGLVGSAVTFFLTLLVSDFFVIHFNLDSNKGRLLEMMGIQLHDHKSFFVLFMLAIVVKWLTQFAEKYNGDRLAEGLIWQIKNELFVAHLKAKLANGSIKNKEKYISNLNADWRGISQWLTKGLIYAGKDLIFLIVGLLFISLIDITISVTVFFSVLALGWLVYFISLIQVNPILAKRKANGAFLSFITKAVYNKTRPSFDISEAELKSEFDKKAEVLKRANRKNQLMESLLSAIIPIFPFIIMGLILVEMAAGLTTISGPQGLLIILFLLLMQGALRRIFKAPSIWRKGQLSVTKAMQIIEHTQSLPSITTFPIKNHLKAESKVAGF